MNQDGDKSLDFTGDEKQFTRKSAILWSIFINLLSIYAIFLVFLLNYVKDIYQKQQATINNDAVTVISLLIRHADICNKKNTGT